MFSNRVPIIDVHRVARRSFALKHIIEGNIVNERFTNRTNTPNRLQSLSFTMGKVLIFTVFFLKQLLINLREDRTTKNWREKAIVELRI